MTQSAHAEQGADWTCLTAERRNVMWGSRGVCRRSRATTSLAQKCLDTRQQVSITHVPDGTIRTDDDAGTIAASETAASGEG